MHISNQLKKDLEGFLEDLYLNRQLSTELKEEELVGRLTPKIEEFFKSYNSPIYNQERVGELKNNLVKEIHSYVKVDSEFREYLNIRKGAREIASILTGSIYAIFGKVLTGSTVISLIAYLIGYSITKKKGIPITKEYTELETKRKQKIEEILG